MFHSFMFGKLVKYLCGVLFFKFSVLLFGNIWFSPRNLLGSPESNHILLLLILCIYKYIQYLDLRFWGCWDGRTDSFCSQEKGTIFVETYLQRGRSCNQLMPAWAWDGMGFAAITVSGPIVSCKLDTHITSVKVREYLLPIQCHRVAELGKSLCFVREGRWRWANRGSKEEPNATDEFVWSPFWEGKNQEQSSQTYQLFEVCCTVIT